MVDSLVDDRPYVVICQKVNDLFALTSVPYELALLKNLKLMGYCRLSHVKAVSYITYTHFFFKQGKENTDPCGITEDLEQLCQIIKLVIVRHLSMYLQYHICMLMYYIAVLYIVY